MKMFWGAALAFAMAVTAGTAHAQVSVDGTRDAAYGAATATVAQSDTAPQSNFQAPTNTANVGYSIYLTSDANNLYGLLTPDGAAPLQFANLYFDLDPDAGNGSDLGFELGANGATAFIPGKNGQLGFSTTLSPTDYQFATGVDGLEFSLANSLFTSAIPGLAYYGDQGFPATGDPVTLRLSQSFSYSVAGGESYGPDRLGSVTVGGTGAVPEPATWAMMLLGFGVIGFALRRGASRSDQRFNLRIQRIAAGEIA